MSCRHIQARVRGLGLTQSRWPSSCAQAGPANLLTHLDKLGSLLGCKVKRPNRERTSYWVKRQ